jgi:aminoglycoside N3'-acetyltransferase
MTIKALAKDLIRKVHSEVKRREIEKTARHVDQDAIVEGLRGLGIVDGDTIFLHSSLRSLGFVEGGPTTVLSSLLRTIGPNGTLIVPTYYQPGGTIYTTCTLPDYIFDPAIHGTGLGALPAAFLKVPGVCRSLHPTHSVSAVGPHARFVTEAHHTAPSIFGKESPWERFVQLDGKVLGLGVSMGPVTFYHMLEDLVGDAFPLPVKVAEVHHLLCRQQDGSTVRVPVVPLDLAYMPRRIDFPEREDLRAYFWKEFASRDLLRSGPVGESVSWVIGGKAFLDHLRTLMSEGITIYSTADELARRPIG